MDRCKVLQPGWTCSVREDLLHGIVLLEEPLHVIVLLEKGELKFYALLGADPGSRNVLYGQLPKPGVVLVRYAAGWTPELYQRLLQLWKRWHLNKARITCPHQRARGWDYVAPLPGQRLTDVGAWVGGWYSANRLVRIPRELGGLLGDECPECGHRCGDPYPEDLPPEVVDEVFGFPKAEVPLPKEWVRKQDDLLARLLEQAQ